eukprot:COSAG02_NODE_12122_length_1592_cov_1.799062_1_plen_255_part_00
MATSSWSKTPHTTCWLVHSAREPTLPHEPALSAAPARPGLPAGGVGSRTAPASAPTAADPCPAQRTATHLPPRTNQTDTRACRHAAQRGDRAQLAQAAPLHQQKRRPKSPSAPLSTAAHQTPAPPPRAPPKITTSPCTSPANNKKECLSLQRPCQGCHRSPLAFPKPRKHHHFRCSGFSAESTIFVTTTLYVTLNMKSIPNISRRQPSKQHYFQVQSWKEGSFAERSPLSPIPKSRWFSMESLPSMRDSWGAGG